MKFNKEIVQNIFLRFVSVNYVIDNRIHFMVSAPFLFFFFFPFKYIYSMEQKSELNLSVLITKAGRKRVKKLNLSHF